MQVIFGRKNNIKILIDKEDYISLFTKDRKFTLNHGYIRVKYKNEIGIYVTTGIARLIMKPPDDMIVDHINRNPLDNRRKNLRICTRQQNAFNRKVKNGSYSGYKGVSWHFGKYRVNICRDGKRLNLGNFTNKKEAAKEYNKYAKQLFKEYASLNK